MNTYFKNYYYNLSFNSKIMYKHISYHCIVVYDNGTENANIDNYNNFETRIKNILNKPHVNRLNDSYIDMDMLIKNFIRSHLLDENKSIYITNTIHELIIYVLNNYLDNNIELCEECIYSLLGLINIIYDIYENSDYMIIKELFGKYINDIKIFLSSNYEFQKICAVMYNKCLNNAINKINTIK